MQFYIDNQNKKAANYQKLIQSNPLPHVQKPKGKTYITKLTTLDERYSRLTEKTSVNKTSGHSASPTDNTIRSTNTQKEITSQTD